MKKTILLPIAAFLMLLQPGFSQTDNVGIGLSSPYRILHIDAAEPTIRLSALNGNAANSGTIEFAESDNQMFGNFLITYDGSDSTNNKFLIKSWSGGILATRLSIDRNSGRTGIGNTDPLYNLHIGDGTFASINTATTQVGLTENSGSGRTAYVASTGNPLSGGIEAFLEADGNSGKVTLGSASEHPLHIRTSNEDRMVVSQNGNVGVGTANPLHLLEVFHLLGDDSLSTSMTGNRLVFHRSSNGASYIDKADSSDLRFRFGPGSTDRVIMKNDGRMGIGTTNPTNRLDILSNGPSDTSDIVLGLMSDISNRPVLQFSEGITATPNSGMSIEYDGTAASVNNKLHIRGVDAIPKFTFKSGGNMGIGITEPNEMLEVAGSGRMFVGDGQGANRKGLLIDGHESGGFVRLAPFDYGPDTSMNLYIAARVGIGTSLPPAQLTVYNASNPTVRLGANGTNNPNSGTIEFCELSSQPDPNFQITYDGSANRLLIKSGAGLDTRLAINRDNGTIGMGGALSVPAGYVLAIDGKVISEEIRVENSDDWPDYVFDLNYALPGIHEVEQFIHTYGHLPNIPSAEQIESDGQHLGDIQRRLLEKVEELTLYVIELHRDNNNMQTRLEELERELIELKGK